MFEICILKEDGKNYIFDTGYPGLIIDKNKIPNFAKAERDFGQQLDGLVGCEYIQKAIWHFNSNSGIIEKVTFANYEGYKPFTFKRSNTLIVVSVLLDDDYHQMYIDTGSSVSYLVKSELSGNLNLQHEDIASLVNGKEFFVKGRVYNAFIFDRTCDIEVFETPQPQLPNILGANFMMKFEWILDLANNTFWIK